MQKGITKVWIVIIAVLVLAGGTAAAYFATNGFGTEQENNGSSNSSTQSEVTEDGRSLLKSALSGNASIVCTYELEDGSEGTAYLKANRHYSIEQSMNDGSGDFRFIKLDDYGYTWQEGESQGVKMDASGWDEQYKEQVEILDTETIEEESEGTQNIDCQETSSFDDDLFTPPSNVEFINFGEEYQLQSS